MKEIFRRYRCENNEKPKYLFIREMELCFLIL